MTSLIFLLDSQAIDGVAPPIFASRAVGRAMRMGYYVRPLYKLSPPVVVLAIQQLGGTSITTATQPRQYSPRETSYRLRPPTAIGAGIAFHGPRVKLVSPVSPRELVRRRPDYNLGKPTVVSTPAVFGGPRTELTYSRRGQPKSFLPKVIYDNPIPQQHVGALTPLLGTVPATISFLRPPTVLATPFAGTPLKVELAYSRRGKANSFLPKVILDALVYDPIAGYLTLVRDKVPPTISFLRPPSVVTASFAGTLLKVELVRIRPAAVHSVLREPIVVGPILARAIATHLAYSRRGAPKPHLEPPAVVAPVLARAIYTHLAYSRRGVPKSHLEPPAVVAPVLARAIKVELAYSKRGVPKSRLPQVVYGPVRYKPIAGYLTRPLDRVPPVHSNLPQVIVDAALNAGISGWLTRPLDRVPKTRTFLRPPTVVTVVAADIYYGPSTSLAYSRRGKAASFLRPMGPIALVYEPIRGRLTGPRDRVPPVRSFLRPPSADTRSIGYLRTHLAYSLRGTPKSHLEPPAVVAPVLARAIAVHLAYSKRGAPKSHLSPPTIVFPFVARPVDEEVVVLLAKSERPKTISRLFPPTVIDNSPQTYYIQVSLAYSLRGKPKSKLFPAVPAESFPPVHEEIAVQLTRARLERRLAISRLSSPAVIGNGIAFYGPGVRLAPSFRGKPKSRLFPAVPAESFPPVHEEIAVQLTRARLERRLAMYRLGPPAVIDNSPQTYYLAITLAYSLRGKPKSFLGKPTDLVDQQDVGFVKVHLAYSRRGTPKSHLAPPTVVAPVLARAIYVHLAPSSRGKAKPKLAPPTVVFAFVPRPVDEEVVVLLAKSERPKTISRLFPPTVIDNSPQVYYLAVTLAYSRRGAPKSILREPVPAETFPPVVEKVAVQLTRARLERRLAMYRLFPPAVVNNAPQTYYIATTLAYSLRGKPKSHLYPPTDLVDSADLGFVKVHLAQIRPPRTHPFLRAPVVVTLATPYLRPIYTHLAPSSRGIPKSRLSEPIVVGEVFTDTTAIVHLAYSLRGKPKSHLSAPTVVGPVLARAIYVHLAPSSRGIPKSKLFPPAVVGPVLARPLDEELTVILAKAERPKTTSRLFPPAVLAPVLARAIYVHLAPSTRGRPKSELFPPAVVAPVLAPAIDEEIVVILSKAERPKTISRLYPPTVVFPFIATPIKVELVRIRPPRTVAKLAPPTVVAPILARAISTHLAYSLRGKPKSILRLPVPPETFPPIHEDIAVQLVLAYRERKTISRLSPPTVVFPFFARAIDVTLVRIRPVATRWLLGKPTDLVDQADVGYVKVHLAYSLRGKTKSRLQPPTVVAPVLAQPIRVELVRIRPAAVHSILRKPTVIDVRPQTYYVSTWLTYSLRGEPKSYLRPDSKFAPQPAARYTILTHLAYQSRGKPKSKLRPPTVVTAATPYFRREPVTLVRIRPRRTIALIRRPIDLVDRDDLGFVRVHLAYSLRGRPKSILREPIVVTEFIARAIKVELAPSRFPRPKSRLLPVPAAFQPVGQLEVKLTYSRRGAPKSRLFPPTDLVDFQDLGYVRVHLAYSSRGKAKPFLSPPAVVAPVLARHEPETLAYSLRGKPKSRLFGVVYEGRVYAPIRVELAPSTRLARAPHSRLEPPTVVTVFIARPISVKLAKTPPKSTVHFLRPPTVIRIEYYFGPEVRLTRIRPPRTIVRLYPPTVVAPPPPPAIEAHVDVHLAYSVRGKPKSKITFTPGSGVPGVICPDGVLDLSEVCGVVLTDSDAILPGGVLDTDTVSGGDATGPAVIMGEDLAEYRVDQEIE